MDLDKLLKIAKCCIAGSTAIALAACIAIPLIKSSRSKGPTTWVQDSYAEDINRVSAIKYARNMFAVDGAGVSQKPARPSTIVSTADISGKYTSLSQECNQALLSICQKNFSVSVGTVTLSPLIPMVIANVETGIRCDPSITFSSLYPSKILKPTSASDIYNASCLDVISSESNFKELAAEWWTRDRGPCQMNPSYGVRDDIYYAAMGRSEKDVLSNIFEDKDYTAYTTKEGVITYSHWIQNASDEKGDRFNPKDICLRLSSEYNYALTVASATYSIDTELLAVAMCAMHHGAGSLWLPEYSDQQIGLWNSGQRAYELACSLTTQAAYNYIKDKVVSDLSGARSRGGNPQVSLSTAEANDIYSKLQSKQIVKEQSYYMSGGAYSNDYAVYAIKALYSYVQLSLLYNGG